MFPLVQLLTLPAELETRLVEQQKQIPSPNGSPVASGIPFPNAALSNVDFGWPEGQMTPPSSDSSSWSFDSTFGNVFLPRNDLSEATQADLYVLTPGV